MKYWTKNRVAWQLLAVGAFVGLLIGLYGTVDIPFPALFGGPGVVTPIANLAPLLLAISASWSLGRSYQSAEQRAVRSVRALDVGHFAFALAILVAGGLIFTKYPELVYSGMRNSIGFLGLVLVSSALLTANVASAVAATWVFVTVFFGSTYGGYYFWAWNLKEAGDLSSWVIAFMLLAAGAVAYLWWPNARRK